MLIVKLVQTYIILNDNEKQNELSTKSMLYNYLLIISLFNLIEYPMQIFNISLKLRSIK